MSLPVMEITLVKAARPGDRDHAYRAAGDIARRGPVHVIHDLPHLVVESVFGITEGLRAELAAGSHAAAGHAASARHPRRRKQGRIASGAAAGAQPGQWFTPGTAGPRRSRTARPTGVAMARTPRTGPGPVARANDPSWQDLPARLDDQTIAMAIWGARDLERRWMAAPPGGTLKLSWPLTRDLFAEATESPATANNQNQPDTERPVRAPPSRRASRPDHCAERRIFRLLGSRRQ
jgi:hypothetical protein